MYFTSFDVISECLKECRIYRLSIHLSSFDTIQDNTIYNNTKEAFGVSVGTWKNALLSDSFIYIYCNNTLVGRHCTSPKQLIVSIFTFTGVIRNWE